MEKREKRVLLLVCGFLGIMLLSCNSPGKTGLLQGKVAIGPLTPVEQPGQTTTVPCEVFQLRKIMVYNEAGDKLIKQVDIDCNEQEDYARYRVELEPGIYTIDINHTGVDFSKGLPEQVEIKPGMTVNLDIDIDTGIR
ncbi:MAG: hypothetical protein JW954_05945 [Dehalococcoidaceae bacterium]|nr:hypothetical protein [Dehalococcoidaceae bacterium]